MSDFTSCVFVDKLTRMIVTCVLGAASSISSYGVVVQDCFTSSSVAMPPTRVLRRLRHKTARKQVRVALANDRMKARRAALHALNQLISDMDLPLPRLRRKHVNLTVLGKVLRVLSKRCEDGSERGRFVAALQEYTANGGSLPEGMEFREADGLMDDTNRGAQDDCAVPRHKTLVMSFRLKSKAFMLTYNSSTLEERDWEAFVKHIRRLARRFGARAWSACLEESEHASRQPDSPLVFHTHAYLFWTDGVGLQLTNLDPFRFKDIRPRVDVCTIKSPGPTVGAPRREVLHGLWYVAVRKKGTRKADTNYKAWAQYQPSVSWLTSLWDGHKLSHEQYLELSALFRSGHAKRKRDVLEVRREEYAAAVKKHVADEAAVLDETSPLHELRSLPEIEAFVKSFESPTRRKPILVIVGGTNSGKSLLAADVLRRICLVVGCPTFLEVTVEGDGALDLSRYDLRDHGGVLFDGVGDVATLWRHREVLQGRPKITYGGRSATMMFAYPYTLARRAVVATFDLTATNLHLLRTNHWLKESSNVCLVRLSAAAWIDPNPGSVVPRPRLSPRSIVAAWTTEEVALFFSQQDADGLGSTLRSNAVNGRDLLAFTSWMDLQQELHMTPFASKKILRLRDAFLNGLVEAF